MNTNTRALSGLLPAAHPAAASEVRAAGTAAPAPGMDFASLMGGARLQAAQAPAAASRPEAPPSQMPQTPPQPAGNTSAQQQQQQQSRVLNERRERERVHDRAAEQRVQQARQHAARSSSSARAAGEAGTAEGEDKARAAADDKQVAVTPLAEWLASLNPATPQLPAAHGEAGASAQDTLEAGAGSDPPWTGATQQQQRHAGGLRRGTAAVGAEAAAADAAAEGERFELPTAEAQATQASQAAAAASASIEGAGPTSAKPNADALAAVSNLTPPTPGVGSSADAAAPAAVDVPTPATDPDFPDVLATQVSVLVKDGVQQAELHLNPAEMGPISVQIAVDGTQAQVDFAAAAGATREIIESSLPMLAAALHEAGLTLAGGGVFEHGRHHAGGARQDGSSPTSQRSGGGGEAGGPEGTAASAPPARRVAHRGMLDLYA